jgi:ATP-dependent protease ClpP protease subunit
MIEVKVCGVIGTEVDVNAIIGNWDCSAPEVLLAIDSQGGAVFDGFRLSEHIEQQRAKGQRVTAKIIGECYSIATVIACACDSVTMNKYALYMIHSPTVSVEDASSDDLRKTAEMTDKVADSIAQVYATKTGKGKEELLKLMQETAFFTAKEAQNMKLVDSIYSAIAEVKNKWKNFRMVAKSTEAEAAKATEMAQTIQQEIETETELAVCDKCGVAHDSTQNCAETPAPAPIVDNMEIEARNWQTKFDDMQAKMTKLEAEYAALKESQSKMASSTDVADLKLRNLAGKMETPPAKQTTGKMPVRTNRF